MASSPLPLLPPVSLAQPPAGSPGQPTTAGWAAGWSGNAAATPKPALPAAAAPKASPEPLAFSLGGASHANGAADLDDTDGLWSAPVSGSAGVDEEDDDWDAFGGGK